MQRISILPATGIDTAYTYKSEESIAVGTYVKISFGRQEVVGVAWSGQIDEALPLSKLKKIIDIYDAPPMSQAQMDYIEKVASWTMTAKGSILKMVIPSFKLLEPSKKTLAYYCESIGNGTEVTLSSEQSKAVEVLNHHMNNTYSCLLLDGVTGSGKTEVFFEAVATILSQGKQVLIMMPEIALTGGFVDRFEARFGVRAALWHSQMTPKQRKTVWHGVANGMTKAVIGARSSLFLPFADLGLVVVDEEHDPSYKQEDNVIYHARDMAVMRGAMFGHPVVLSSATPSLETLWNVQSKRYHTVSLPDRFGGAMMPEMHMIDMRIDKPEKGEFIAPTLHQAILETLQKKEQVLLFLNRRGYAPLTLCRSCGAKLECPQCTSWLVAHKKTGRTFCHHCGYGGRSPHLCPSCGVEDSLIPIGPGVERIAEECELHYPEAKIIVMSSDSLDEGDTLKDKLDAIQKGDVDIIIGTQMTAKGHHFPKLTCVGVVDADVGMKGGDLRAGERTWQLLHQVAGRAGREVLSNDRKGQVYLQSYMPENLVIQSLLVQDRQSFCQHEMESRQFAQMPPYTRLAAIIISGKNEKSVELLGRELAKTAPRSDEFIVMGPAVPAFAMLRGKHRRRLLVQASRKINLQKTLAEWMAHIHVPSTLRLTIDIDPQSFL